jgi:hypothetical protein
MSSERLPHGVDVRVNRQRVERHVHATFSAEKPLGRRAAEALEGSCFAPRLGVSAASLRAGRRVMGVSASRCHSSSA